LLGAFAVSGCNCSENGLVNVKPLLVPDPDSIDFGLVAVGDLRVKDLKLENKGGVSLTIKSITFMSMTPEEAMPNFVFVTPPPMTIGAGMTMDFNIAFQPQSVGDKMATVSIDTNDGKGPHIITLKGTGIMASVIATHDGDACSMANGDSMSFGMIAPGMTVDRTVTVKATGTDKVTILSAVLEPGSDPAFTFDPIDMGHVLNPGESLAIKGHYMPATGGPSTGTFVITTNNPQNPSIKIALCGQGIAPAICAQRIDFGAVALGDTAMNMVHVTSCGTEPVDVSAVKLASDAQHMSNAEYTITAPMVPQTLQPMQAIDVPVKLMPSVLGSAKAWLQVTSTAYGRPDSFFEIDGNGAQPCSLDVQPMTVNFRTVMPGSSATQNVLMTNSGATSCTVTSISVTAGAAVFSITPAPHTPLTLASGAAATLTVKYSPTQNNTMDTGTLTVVGGSMKTVQLIGNAPPPMGCQLQAVPSAVNFGVVQPGNSRVAGVTLTNVSANMDLCQINSASLDPSSSTDFHFMNQGFTLIPPGFPPLMPPGSAQLAVTYIPTQMGSATGKLNIMTNDVVNPNITVPLFASSATPGICVTPRNLPFGPTVGSNTMAFTISACGSRTVTVNSLNWTMPDPAFALVTPPSLPFMLTPGQSQGVSVQFTSSDMSGHTAVVTVGSDDPGAPSIDVTATGGPQIVPVTAGRYLYYWQIPGGAFSLGGDIMRVPLQGVTTPSPYWGPRTGKQCSGCHNISPDGHYVALLEFGAGAGFRVVDTTTDIALTLPNNMLEANFMSWNPNVNTNPPYQYVYDDGSDVWVASLFGGTMGKLAGANDPSLAEQMPSWGTDGKIYFARGKQAIGGNMGNNTGNWGIDGPADILWVPEAGGTAQPVPGASGNMLGNYYPKVSPNAQWIAFTFSQSAQTSFAAKDARVQLIKNDGSGTVLPLNNLNVPSGCVPDPSCMNSNDGCSNGCSTSYPNWSIDGAFLSFSSNRAGGKGNWDIWIATVDPMTGQDGTASNVAQANTSDFEHSAEWSP
jgi:hypothetical protein